MIRLTKYIREMYGECRRITNIEEQRMYGDLESKNSNGKPLFIEVKTEQSMYTNNFFWETWSNWHNDNSRNRKGWMLTLCVKWFLYFFYDEGRLYRIPFDGLLDWAFELGNIYGKYDERAQKKYVQKNNTRGVCVPINVIRQQVGFEEYEVMADGSFHELDQAIAIKTPVPPIIKHAYYQPPKPNGSLF